MQLHDTIMGKRLIEKINRSLPEIAKQLKRIADSLEHIENSFTSNDEKESISNIISHVPVDENSF